MSIYKNIIAPFAFTQSYRERDQQPAPDNYPMYSETFTVSKIRIDASELISIRNVLVQMFQYTTKRGLDNPPKLLLFMSDESTENEFNGNSSFTRLVDSRAGIFSSFLNISIPPADSIIDNPYRLAYYQVYEYPGDDTNQPPNYENASAYYHLIGKQACGSYIIAGNTFSSSSEILITNKSRYNYLYIIPFTPKLQKTEIAVSGQINFDMEYN